MADVQQEFDIGASLLGLYKDLPHVRKLGCVVGELGERIIAGVIIDGDNNAGEFREYAMAAVGRAMDFEDMLPADMRERYEAAPIVADPCEGALWHFGTIAAVTDR